MNNNPFAQVLTGAVEETIKVQEKGRKPQMRVPIAARFDRRGSFRGEFPMLVRAEEVTHTSPAAAELASRLAANHRLLHNLGAGEEIITPAGLIVPRTKPTGRFDMDVTVETILARQAELVAQSGEVGLTSTTTVFQPVAEFIPLETRPQRIYKLDGRWFADDVEMLKRALHRVMDWRQMPPKLADGFTKGAIRHPDVHITNGETPDEAWIHVTAAKAQIPLTPQDRDLDWGVHLHVQHMLTSMPGIDPAPMAGYRVMSPTLRYPTGIKDGRVQYGPWEPGEEYRDLESAGWFELASAPASWARKIAESFLDVPGIFGTSAEWTRRFFDVILLQAGRDYRRNGAYVELSHGEFFRAIHGLRADLVGHPGVSRDFIEGFDTFGKEIASAMRTRLRAHWLRQFTLERVGLDRLTKAAEANLSEQMEDPEDAAAFWRVYPALALHGVATLPAYTPEQNLWLDLAAGKWPALWQAPQATPWAFAESEYRILAGEEDAPTTFGVVEEVTPIAIGGFSWDFDVDMPVPVPADAETAETIELVEAEEAPRVREVAPRPVALDLIPKERVKEKRRREPVQLEPLENDVPERAPLSEAAMEVSEALAHFGPGFHVSNPDSYAAVKRLHGVVVARMDKLAMGESEFKYKQLQGFDAGLPHLEKALTLLQPTMTPTEVSAAVADLAATVAAAAPAELAVVSEADVQELTSLIAEGEALAEPEAEVLVEEIEPEVATIVEEAVEETLAEIAPELETLVEEAVAETIAEIEPEVATIVEEAVEEAITESEPEQDAPVEETIEEVIEEASVPTEASEETETALPEAVQVQEDSHEALIAGAELAPAPAPTAKPERVFTPATQLAIMQGAMELVSKLGIAPATALVLSQNGVFSVESLQTISQEDLLGWGLPISNEELLEIHGLAALEKTV
jgi:hypothetical protein